MLKTVFCLVGVLCIVELNTRSILSIFFATLALLYTLCYLQCAQYKRQPTDCHRCRARLYTQSTYEPALGKASKNETKNKYENEDEWDQIGKHKDSRNAIWNKIAQKNTRFAKNMNLFFGNAKMLFFSEWAILHIRYSQQNTASEHIHIGCGCGGKPIIFFQWNIVIYF